MVISARKKFHKSPEVTSPIVAHARLGKYLKIKKMSNQKYLEDEVPLKKEQLKLARVVVGVPKDQERALCAIPKKI